MDPVLYADFLSSYKRKLKDNFFSIEFKVSLCFFLRDAMVVLRPKSPIKYEHTFLTSCRSVAVMTTYNHHK